MSLDLDAFISEIQVRPAIYDTKLKEYFDKSLKRQLWIELCKTFVDNWSELEVAEKDKEVQKLQKKWKHLRTCFKREYDIQKQEPSGPGSKKRRKYLYYDQLLFLRGSVEVRPTSSNSDSWQTQIDNTEEAENVNKKNGTPQATTRFKAGYKIRSEASKTLNEGGAVGARPTSSNSDSRLTPV
ncbi:hypothetical protein J437_LFUL003638 [Ladona fulva]|uniref:MADF domain-containing protein n=1 Tax=Ladona fulva TaxID=123851 RepID=A0A8K0NW08_LADFU|nr:hypothetical protein J437_LFUL003638 [Ladona fulva]